MITAGLGAPEWQDAAGLRQAQAAREASPAASPRAASPQGRRTVRKLLDAGLAEFAERGFQAVTVDDIARRADTSHGTFYLYFANKDDFFGVLARGALQAMETLAGDFPVVTPTDAGRSALRNWVGSFCGTYAAHAPVIKTLSDADLVGRDIWAEGFATLVRLADAIAVGMAAGMSVRAGQEPAARVMPARLDALALLMMLERVNYLLSTGIGLPKEAMIDRLTRVIFAAFNAPETKEAA